jgi:acyl dehydratase
MTTASSNPIVDIKLPTLAELLAKTPVKYQPFVTQLGPGLLAMASVGLDQITAWIARVAAGDTLGAYKQVVDALPSDSFIRQWEADDALLDQHNAANAAQLAAAKHAAALCLEGLVGIAGLLVGL